MTRETAPRRRSRYAPDEQVERAFRLARADGIRPAGLTLGADGSVTVLDTAAIGGLSMAAQGDDPDAALAAWKATHGSARRQ